MFVTYNIAKGIFCIYSKINYFCNKIKCTKHLLDILFFRGVCFILKAKT